ncbi:hypothetical protein CEXT_798211 [Caerostris extrusa]|uniref:Uncharacterized protein n=1 Tax=Caerostris extrusa TaxID=172846 RepID=A0AAV4V934_CAEEX|nr:hypothetical protein CEXT_798211 [Caerostris extrusa]
MDEHTVECLVKYSPGHYSHLLLDLPPQLPLLLKRVEEELIKGIESRLHQRVRVCYSEGQKREIITGDVLSEKRIRNER